MKQLLVFTLFLVLAYSCKKHETQSIPVQPVTPVSSHISERQFVLTDSFYMHGYYDQSGFHYDTDSAIINKEIKLLIDSAKRILYYSADTFKAVDSTLNIANCHGSRYNSFCVYQTINLKGDSIQINQTLQDNGNLLSGITLKGYRK